MSGLMMNSVNKKELSETVRKFLRNTMKNIHIKQVKKEVRQDKIMECKGNSRRLFEIFNSMTGKRNENPMPEGKTDEELANEFLGFYGQNL